MCGRYVLKAPPAELVTRFSLDECVDFAPRYNIAPNTGIPTIYCTHEGKRVLHLMHWGLIPHWAKDSSIGHRLINARGETVAESPRFAMHSDAVAA
jgi:putative SOS response-associated peptidase YedK